VCGEREECVMREKYKIKQLCVIKECLRFNSILQRKNIVNERWEIDRMHVRCHYISNSLLAAASKADKRHNDTAAVITEQNRTEQSRARQCKAR
jgi:hypothetical protein